MRKQIQNLRNMAKMSYFNNSISAFAIMSWLLISLLQKFRFFGLNFFNTWINLFLGNANDSIITIFIKHIFIHKCQNRKQRNNCYLIEKFLHFIHWFSLPTRFCEEQSEDRQNDRKINLPDNDLRVYLFISFFQSLNNLVDVISVSCFGYNPYLKIKHFKRTDNVFYIAILISYKYIFQSKILK